MVREISRAKLCLEAHARYFAGQAHANPQNFKKACYASRHTPKKFAGQAVPRGTRSWPGWPADGFSTVPPYIRQKWWVGPVGPDLRMGELGHPGFVQSSSKVSWHGFKATWMVLKMILLFFKFSCFPSPRSLREFISGNPQHEKPRGELLRWSGARDRHWPPQIFEGVKSPHPPYCPY